MSNQTRKVHFTKNDTIHEIRHINDMDDEEFHAVFFSVGERRTMRHDFQDLIRTIDEGLHIIEGQEVFETRGLMSHTKDNLRRSRELRDTLYGSILAAQRSDDGWGNLEDSCDSIAKLSRNVTAISKGKALATARQDAQEVLTKESFSSKKGDLHQDSDSSCHPREYSFKQSSGQPPCRRSSFPSDLQAALVHPIRRRILKRRSIQGRSA